MDDDLPMDTSRDVFYFNEGALAYAGYYLHAEDNPLHAHSFVEIASAVGGAGTHHCVAGRRELRAGMSSCFGPASGTGTNSASGWSCTTAGALYLRSIPASTGDIKLITVIGAVGVLLGLLAGALMKVRLTEDGSLVTVTGASYAAVWIAAIEGRLLFAYGANHWFAPEIASFSRSVGIDDAAAYTAAFVIMALAMVVTRVAVTAFRAFQVTGDIPWNEHQEVVGLRHDHAHLHHHAH